MVMTGAPRESGASFVCVGETTTDTEALRLSAGDTSLGDTSSAALTAMNTVADAISARVAAVTRAVRRVNLRLSFFMFFGPFSKNKMRGFTIPQTDLSAH